MNVSLPFLHIAKLFLITFGIIFLYFVLGKLGLCISVPPGYATLIWPPSGLALAAALLYGHRSYVGIFLGSFLVNLTIIDAVSFEHGVNWGRATIPEVIAFGSTLQAVVARQFIFAVFGKPIHFKSWIDFAVLVFILLPVCCLIASGIAVSALFFGGIVSSDHFLNNMATWWFGDYLGITIFTPAAMFLPMFPRIVKWKNRWVSGLPVLAIYMLFIPLGLTFYAWKVSSAFLYDKNTLTFAAQVLEAEKSLVNRLDSYELVLKGARGFFLGSDYVSPKEWTEYADSLHVEKNFPGINGIGWILKVNNSDVPQFLQWVHKEKSPDFTIHPDTSLSSDSRYVITYIEPEYKNKEAVGLDVSFEQNRFDAANIAMGSGETALTRKIILVQDAQKTPGFLLYVPLYNKNMPIDTIEQRKAAFQGWIYAPFIARNFMHNLVSSQGRLVHIRLYDGEVINDDALIYDSNKFRNLSAPPNYSKTEVLHLKQNTWTVVYDSTPAFDAYVHSHEAELILVGGFFITFLFGGFLYFLSRQSEQVKLEVENKTQELRSQKEQLQLIFDSVPSSIWYKDDANNMLRLNKRAAQAMGGNVEDFEGKNTAEFFPEMAEKYLEDDLVVIRSGEPLLGIVEKFTPVSAPHGWVRTNKVPFDDPVSGKQTLLVVSEDITEQKDAEDKLIKSEARYDLVVKGMSAGLWDWEVVSGDSFWSEQFRRILGLSADVQASDAAFMNLIHPDDVIKVQEAIQSHYRDRNPFGLEFRMRHADGHYIWVHGTGQAAWNEDDAPVRMAGSIADISAKKYAEDALIRSEELNNLAVRGMSVGLWDWNILTGEITTSYKMHEILGWSFGSDFVSNFDEFLKRVHPDDVGRLTMAINSHLVHRVPYDVEYRLQMEDGNYIWLQACGQAKWDENGTATRMVGSIANIDSRKKAEEKLIQSNMELERFAYVASHDLQEPLRMVRNFTQILNEEYSAKFDESAKEYMGFIINGATRMQALVSDLLEYSRADKAELDMQDIECQSIMKAVEENLKQVLADSGGRIYYDNLPTVWANPIQLLRLLQNLVGNGLKYRRKGVNPEIVVDVQEDDDKWLFSVADNGIGIKEEYLDQIFVIFKRLHRNNEYEGTGIGLSICKKVVENMGGEIWVESEYGEGSTFYFTIPKNKNGGSV